MSSQAAIIDEYRSFYARHVATQGRQRDQPVGCAFVTRLEGAFATVPRELFLPPGPWHIFAVLGGRYVETPSTDAWYVYQDVLVAIDKNRGIHNGQPSIHAAFMSAVEPQPGETLIHVGAGTGYYTAILSMLVAPGGRVEAIEVDEALARTAKRNLAAFDNVSVTIGNASKMSLPAPNVIYVSAGVRWPPVHWLEALEPEGRLFVPWRPAELAPAVRSRSAGAVGGRAPIKGMKNSGDVKGNPLVVDCSRNAAYSQRTHNAVEDAEWRFSQHRLPTLRLYEGCPQP